MKRRILFVVNADWFFISHRLGLALACRDAGYEVALCAGESTCRSQIEAAGIRFFALPIDRGGTHPLRDASTLATLVGVYREFQPDLVHHVTIKPVLYGSIVARALGISGVVNAVSGLGYVFIPRERDGWRNVALRRVLRAAYRVALAGSRVRVIFQNSEDRATFVETKLVEFDRTHLIRGSGVDLEAFRATPLPKGEFVALLPARLLWDKGVGEFVAAAAELKREHPRARFVLVGRLDPDNPAAIARSQVEAWVDQGVVEWWPACAHTEMPALLRQAHVVVLPSYREGLPLALAEAAASARAVVTTDVPGCRDTVMDGQTGWLVRVRDAGDLTRALRAAVTCGPDALSQLGSASRALAEERFDQKRIFSDTLATYAELQ